MPLTLSFPDFNYIAKIPENESLYNDLFRLVDDIKTFHRNVVLELDDINFTIGTSVRTQTFVSQTSVTVTHNMGVYPMVQIIDNTGEFILPLSIIHSSVNAFTITFTTTRSGTILYGGLVTPSNTLDTVTSVSAAYTILNSDDTIICTGSSAFTLTLPTAVGVSGKKYVIKNNSTADITVDGNGSETIDGDTTIIILAGSPGSYGSVTLQSDGSNWIII